MNIAVIGATGAMGSALTRSLAKAGHQLTLFAPDRTKLSDLVRAVQRELPAARVTDAPDAAAAVRPAEVILLAVWYAMQAEVASAVRAVAAGKIVVNIANPLNETFDDVVTPPGTSAAEECASQLPEATVVKAFNTVFAADFAAPDFGGIRPDVFVAGDDERASDIVSTLVRDVGFNPLFVGRLSASRTLERMAVLLIGLSSRYTYNWRAGWKVLHG